jgi:hypothetical protein
VRKPALEDDGLATIEVDMKRDESLGEKHRRYQLTFDQVNSEVKPSGQQRLPKRVIGQQASHHCLLQRPVKQSADVSTTRV